MEFVQTHIPEVVIAKPKVFGDSRGYLMESFRKDLFSLEVGDIDFLQDNESKSGYGVLRGLHYQLPPWEQSKLVRVVYGRTLDVAVDIRKSSPSFGKSVTLEISGENKKQLFIPRGFAHGFLVLSFEAVFAYKMDALYAPEYERNIRFDDPDIGIDWGIDPEEIKLSEKDRQAPYLKNAQVFD